MKLDIEIHVSVVAMTAEQRLEFIEGVMAVFRAGFPEAKPLIGRDAPSPVTVIVHAEDEDDQTKS